MKKLSILLLTWAISIDGYPQIRVFPIDSWHSEIRFTTKFGGLVDVSGRFKEFDGCIIFNENNLLALSASVRIETKTIDTGVEMRDEDLRGKKFFDVVSFPLITFSSKSTFKKDGNYFLVGDLEIHGVNRPIEIAVEQAHGIKKDPWSNDRIPLRAQQN